MITIYIPNSRDELRELEYKITLINPISWSQKPDLKKLVCQNRMGVVWDTNEDSMSFAMQNYDFKSRKPVNSLAFFLFEVSLIIYNRRGIGIREDGIVAYEVSDNKSPAYDKAQPLLSANQLWREYN